MVQFNFEGKPERPRLLFRGDGRILRARIFSGSYTADVWRALMSLNNAVNLPHRKITASMPRLFRGTDNAGISRRKLIIQPEGAAETVLEFDQQIPVSLLQTLREVLGNAPVPPEIPFEAPPDRPKGESHEGDQGSDVHLSGRAQGEPRPGADRRHGNAAKGKHQLRSKQRRKGRKVAATA